MGQVRVVDVDVAFAVSFAMDCAWLWASGQLAGISPRPGRVALAASGYARKWRKWSERGARGWKDRVTW